MNKETILRENFKNKYGENLGIVETKMLNILLHLLCFENILIENISFLEDKIIVNTTRNINEEETISGKYIIYNNAKYAYIENNKAEDTIICMEYNRGMCGIYYKSKYDDFNIERTVGFKIRRNSQGVTFIENDEFNLPLYKCYPLVYEDFEDSRCVSKAIGLMIANNMYNVIDFNIKNKKNLNKKR